MKCQESTALFLGFQLHFEVVCCLAVPWRIWNWVLAAFWRFGHFCNYPLKTLEQIYNSPYPWSHLFLFNLEYGILRPSVCAVWRRRQFFSNLPKLQAILYILHWNLIEHVPDLVFFFSLWQDGGYESWLLPLYTGSHIWGLCAQNEISSSLLLSWVGRPQAWAFGKYDETVTLSGLGRGCCTALAAEDHSTAVENSVGEQDCSSAGRNF